MDELDFQLEPSLDIDDAFSETEDSSPTFQFSPDAIRNDLAKNSQSWRVSEEEEDERQHSNGFFESTSNSDSTLDIDSEAETESSSNFVSIPLSASDSGQDLPASELDEDSGEVTPYPSVVIDASSHQATSSVDNTQTNAPVAPYPSVIIDVSSPKVKLSEETWSAPVTPYSSVLIDEPSHKVTSSKDYMQTSAPLPSVVVQNHSGRSRSHSRSSASSNNSEHSTKSLPAPEPSSVTPTHPTFASSTSTSVLSSAAPAVAASSGLKPSQPIHRPARSVGPSALEKVRSRTRPSFLPPKSRQEDDKHMADWEGMMRQSRAAAEKHRRALQERRLVREKKIEDSLQLWEKEIVPDWRVVLKNQELRKVWWKGIPTKLRASMWERAVGNPLALSKDNFRSCSARAKRALTSGAFSATTLSKIEADITSTLPGLHIFHPETGPLYSDLKDMLCAWVVARADEGLGYSAGAAKIAAMFLISMPIQQAFVVMRNLLERHCLRSFFGGSGAKEDVEAYYRIFDTLLADGMPKIYFNFKQHHISPSAYLPDWLVPLFLDHLPFEACARIWDVVILEGDSFLYRAALGILAVLEPRLFFPDRKELLELLRGENKAAIDVATREGRPLDGGKYEIYGVDEETLWERIDSMDEWWKQSTWNRLIRRELPDL